MGGVCRSSHVRGRDREQRRAASPGATGLAGIGLGGGLRPRSRRGTGTCGGSQRASRCPLGVVDGSNCGTARVCT